MTNQPTATVNLRVIVNAFAADLTFVATLSFISRLNATTGFEPAIRRCCGRTTVLPLVWDNEGVRIWRDLLPGESGRLVLDIHTEGERMKITNRIIAPNGRIYRILPRDGHGIGRKPGYAIWERTTSGTLVYRGAAASQAEAERRIRAGLLTLA